MREKRVRYWRLITGRNRESEDSYLLFVITVCRFRARVARGEETRGSPGPQPSASNMREMVSDTAELSDSEKRKIVRDIQSKITMTCVEL